MINASSGFTSTMISADAKVYARIELLDKNENLIQRFDTYVIDGSITVDKEQDVRRQFSLTVANDDNTFTWSVGGLIWIDKRIRLSIGLMTPAGQIEYIPQGVFLLEQVPAVSKADGTREVTMSGGDKWKLLDGNQLGKFTNTTTIAANVPIDQAIMTLAQQASETKFAFDNTCTVTTPYSLTYQPGEAIGKAIKELADLAVYECFYDVNGYLRFRALPSDMTQQPSVWTYDKSDWTLYAGSQKVLETSQFYNKVLVIGGSQQTSTVSAISANIDPNDPLSTVNVGERLFLYNNGSPDPLITTTTLAQARADWELQNRSKIVERQQFESLANFLHEAGDVITIVDDWISTNDKYQLVRFNVPLKPGGMMSGECIRTRKAGT